MYVQRVRTVYHSHPHTPMYNTCIQTHTYTIAHNTCLPYMHTIAASKRTQHVQTLGTYYIGVGTYIHRTHPILASSSWRVFCPCIVHSLNLSQKIAHMYRMSAHRNDETGNSGSYVYTSMQWHGCAHTQFLHLL